MVKKTYLTGLVGAALGLLAGCGSTPLPPDTGCGMPGGTCAPLPNTSSQAPANLTPERERTPAPGSEVYTRPVELPPSRDGSAGVAPPANGKRVALLLPLEAGALAQPAEALRAGFMAAHERAAHERAAHESAPERAELAIDLVATDDTPASVLQAYREAAARNDIVVGPLARSAVSALASSGLVNKPTIALSHPQGTQAMPANLLVIGLSLEDDARKVADWAASEQPHGKALILTGAAAWQQRLSGAFAARWSQLGRQYASTELPLADGYIDGNALAALRARLQAEPPQFMFAALDAGQLSQVRMALGTSLPTYGTASVNPGSDPARVPSELGGVRLIDLPWMVQASDAALQHYPRVKLDGPALDLQRLYALGIDAYQIARELALDPHANVTIDGVTGRLQIDMGQARAAFARTDSAVVVRHVVQRMAAARADDDIDAADDDSSSADSSAVPAVFEPVDTHARIGH